MVLSGCGISGLFAEIPPYNPPDVSLDGSTETDSLLEDVYVESDMREERDVNGGVDICKVGEYVANNMCLPCPIGTTSSGGDRSDGPNTVCVPVLCGENEYVFSNACITCPEGESNEPGDNSTGPNTSCVADPCWDVFGLLCTDIEDGYVKAPNSDAGDRFGGAIALDGDTLVIGSSGEMSSGVEVPSDNSIVGAGAVYVFNRVDTAWVQQAYIKAPNPDVGDGFGSSVAIDGDTLVVGAFNESSDANGLRGDQGDNSAQGAGAAYVFVRSGSSWDLQAYVKASNSDARDGFGGCVDLSGNTLVVGAVGEGSSADGIDGDQDDNSAFTIGAGGAGAVYVFERESGVWEQQAYIKASNSSAPDRFGCAIDIEDDLLVVGAVGEASESDGINMNQEDDSASSSGAVYVFARSGDVWSQQAYIKASDSNRGDRFGSALSLDGDDLIVGTTSSGKVYWFESIQGNWRQSSIVEPVNSKSGDEFGFSVAVDGDTLVVGAPGEDSLAKAINSDQADTSGERVGAAYIFKRVRSEWVQQAYVKSFNSDSRDFFGESVDVNEGIISIGSPGESSDSDTVDSDGSDNSAEDSGAVYMYSIVAD